ncbi:putative RNA-binding protein with PIN domain [Nocardioides marinisabuli]|uniref:Putative RNA-binding protein with PIN domain n=1 Tax=Nocardioides marinisabuli TaxID=419476 RepID=A0A7Y9JSC4_9ACTN|nr:NYN domain-containing protein [Nocardioides marinisabuli]NYD58448.1 putative RNA-binding protein with PIN domain [Nocardioides marinisabuli]
MGEHERAVGPAAGDGDHVDHDEGGEADVALDALPVAVRTRVVGIVAAVLPEVSGLPPALRRVAGFAPARRARLGGTAIAAALADPDLRERAAHQVATQRAAEVQALREGGSGDALEDAALGWLLRPRGWTRRLDDAVSTVAAREESAERARETRLGERAEQAEQALREARASYRAQVEEQKSEIASLRRRLGETRAAERTAREELERAQGEVEQARAREQAALTAQDKELRRLRARVEELEAQAQSQRRAGRTEREDASARARVLLETVIDAASGLRRELGLPTGSTSPGESVEQQVEDDAARDDASGRTSSPPITASVLEQHLSLPHARLVVDGYNVSKAVWSSSSLETQRTRLLALLAPLAARTRAETTVVFDAAEVDLRPAVSAPRGVKVLFSPYGVIADRVIEDLVAAEPEGRVVLVVTDDQELRARTRGRGVRHVGSRVLLDLLAR